MAEPKTSAGGPLPRRFRGESFYLGTVPKDADLAGYLDGFVRENGIRAGVLGVVGVVAKARLGFYDVEAGKYLATEIEGHREIASCLGNVSLRDGRPGIHAHIVVSDAEGRTAGGHLLDGTIVHYAEFWVAALDGEPFERGLDPETNVTGWVR